MKNELCHNPTNLLSYYQLSEKELYVVVTESPSSGWFYVKSTNENGDVRGVVLTDDSVSVCYWPTRSQADVKMFRKAQPHEYITLRNSTVEH